MHILSWLDILFCLFWILLITTWIILDNKEEIYNG
jgi:hypothetical protein